MDVEGNVLEMASEPAASGMASKIKHLAYPTREWGGMIWSYMGPQDAVPEFRPPQWAPTEETRVAIAKAIIPCNWAQILGGAIDSAHSSSLHSSDMVPARVDTAKATANTWLRPSTDKAPRMQVQRTDYGSSGIGSSHHLSAEAMKAGTGTVITHIRWPRPERPPRRCRR